MDDLFKKFLTTGLGFLSQGNKRVQLVLDKLVQESKISEQEGQKIMDELLKSGETKRQDLEKQLQGLANNLRDRVGLGSEAEAAAPAASAKTTPPKAAAKKPAKPAGPVAKAVDKASAAATKAQRAIAARANAPKKAPIMSADDSGAKTGDVQ